ncbi:MAG: stage III sporulation protein AB [Oscillospiraceae bacterium]|jgi:stage III sporulation protein AA|nr:stage III sporulation protein AB [Oscillospiraceae bacterium]
MNTSDKNYTAALRLLPPEMRERAALLPPERQSAAEELRLRVGHSPTVLLPGGEAPLGDVPVAPRDLDAVVEIATGASAHTSRDTVRAGYINAPGGYRIGLCGAAITDGGEISGFRALSSLAIRIPRARRGVADFLAVALGGKIPSTLLISPPGAGKTTLLRELVRLCSDGSEKLAVPPSRVGLADERGELAAASGGVPQMDVGRRTDVLSSCPKSQAVLMLLRAMNPQTVALDEITAPEDAEAIVRAANCGVRLFATAHAASLDDLTSKPMYRKLLDAGIFRAAVTIVNVAGRREYEVTQLP